MATISLRFTINRLTIVYWRHDLPDSYLSLKMHCLLFTILYFNFFSELIIEIPMQIYWSNGFTSHKNHCCDQNTWKFQWRFQNIYLNHIKIQRIRFFQKFSPSLCRVVRYKENFFPHFFEFINNVRAATDNIIVHPEYSWRLKKLLVKQN